MNRAGQKTKIIAIVGPTASGKSALAVEIAKKFNGEIISADSRQVYIDLDIGTGKITKKEMRGIPHHLLNVASPRTVFTVQKFKKLAKKKIVEIASRGKLPILCGGTGFYIDALLKNISYPEARANITLRKRLSKMDVTKLFAMLQKKDPRRADTIDPKNRHRLIRAIEIAFAFGTVPPLAHTESPYTALTVGITLPVGILRKKIHERLTLRVKRGLIAEAIKLRKNGLSLARMKSLGLEYHYLALYLEKKLTKDEMIQKLETEIWHYARRQMTWFKRDKNILWFNPKGKSKIEKVIKDFL